MSYFLEGGTREFLNFDCRARLTLNRCRRLGIFKDFQTRANLKNIDLEVCHRPRISGPTRASPNAAEEGYKVQRVESRFTRPIDKNRKMAVGKCRLFLIAAQLGKHAVVLKCCRIANRFLASGNIFQ